MCGQGRFAWISRAEAAEFDGQLLWLDVVIRGRDVEMRLL